MALLWNVQEKEQEEGKPPFQYVAGLLFITSERTRAVTLVSGSWEVRDLDKASLVEGIWGYKIRFSLAEGEWDVWDDVNLGGCGNWKKECF